MVRARPRRRPGATRGRGPGCRRCSASRRSRRPWRGGWPPPPAKTDTWQLLLDLVPAAAGGRVRPRRARAHPRGRRGVRGDARGRSEAGARVAVRGAAARGRERQARTRAAAPRGGDRRLRGPGARARRDHRGRRRAAAHARPPARAARQPARDAPRGSRGGGGELRGRARADARAARAAAQPRSDPGPAGAVRRRRPPARRREHDRRRARTTRCCRSTSRWRSRAARSAPRWPRS